MRQTLLALLVALSLTAVQAIATPAQPDLKSVIAGMIKAQGGADKLRAIKTSVTEGTITMVSQGGVSGALTITMMYPDKSLTEMVFGGTRIAQGFNGTVAWMDNPMAGGFQTLPENQRLRAAREAIGFEVLLHPEQYGITYSYLGKQPEDGREYHVIEQKYQNGDKTTIHVDVNSYLVHKTIIGDATGGQAPLEETYYEDYRTTDGITQPYRASLRMNGQEVVRYDFVRVTYNPKVYPDMFTSSDQRFTQEELVADARQLAAIIEDTHPCPYQRIGGRIAFHRQFQNVLNSIPEGGMTANEFKALLLPFVAAIGDAHTEVFAYHNVDLTAPGGLPLKFNAVDQSLIVSGIPDKRYEYLLGAQLASVEGVNLDELGRRLSRIRPIDNQYYLLWLFTTTYLWYAPYLQELLPEWQNCNQIRAAFRQASGEITQVTFDLPANVSALSESDSRMTLPVADKSGLASQFLGRGKKTLYLRVEHMKYFRESFEARNSLGLDSVAESELNGIPSATEFFRSLVSTMKDARTEALIVDLRHNEGGDALMADVLMYFLHGKDAAIRTRWNNVTRLSAMYLSTRSKLTLEDINKGRRVPLVKGDYDFGDMSPDVPSVGSASLEAELRLTPTFYKEWESGSFEHYYCPPAVIVLTRPETFSAGFGVAVRLSRAGATLVGTPSGQAPNSGGNALGWTLDNTGIEGRVSQSYVINLPDDSSRFLPVHYPLTAELCARYSYDPNTEVLYAVDLAPDIVRKGE